MSAYLFFDNASLDAHETTQLGEECGLEKLFLERKQKGEYNTLVKDMMLFDHEYFFKMFRMTPSRFEELLSWVAPHIQKCSKFRDVASPSERLCVTLRYVATGDAQSTLASSYRISPSVVSRIIRETCSAIWTVLSEKKFLIVPSTEEEWLEISLEYRNKWNFPHCLGAIDGKHVVMQAPERSGSDYYNYKKTHSIVLLAVCNARYEFLLVDIGDAGCQSDGGVYNNSKLGYAIDKNLINMPYPSNDVSSDGKYYPFVFVADDAFQMKEYMLKPFSHSTNETPKKIFNYRLSRARRVIENTFGIAAARFRIFRRPIIAEVETVSLITKAVIALHNYLMKSQDIFGEYRYCPFGFVDQENISESAIERAGDWRYKTQGFSGLVNTKGLGSNNYSRSAKAIREDFMNYFIEEGSVSWQNERIHRTIDPFDA